VALAAAQGEVATEPPGTLPILPAMSATAGMFVVRADSRYRTIDSLRGQPIAFGARGSGLVILARYVLDGLDLDQQRDFQAVYLDRAGDGPAMVQDGRVAGLWGGGLGWPGVMTVARWSGGARCLGPDAAGIQRVQAKHPFLKTLTVPADAYPGIEAPLTSVGSWSFVMTRPTLPDDVAYRLARALHRGEAALAKRLPQAAETAARHKVDAAPPAGAMTSAECRSL